MAKIVGNLILLIFGVTVTVVSATENPSEDFADFHGIHWIGFVLLPLASGLGIRIAMGVLSARTAGKVTNTIHYALVVALMVGLLVLWSDRIFVIENRNNVFLGIMLAGLALGGLAIRQGTPDVKDN